MTDSSEKINRLTIINSVLGHKKDAAVCCGKPLTLL